MKTVATKDARPLPISEAALLASLGVAKGTVLVGGRALAFWLAHFRRPLPPGSGSFRDLVDAPPPVAGLDAEGVRRRAIPVTHPGDADVQFAVMNPVDCLIGRFDSLRQLAEECSDVGVWQAAISIVVCRAYLEKLLALGQEPAAVAAATRVLRLAGAASGLQAFRHYQLDAIAAIPVERFTATALRARQHAKTVRRIGMLRAARQMPAGRGGVRRGSV